MFTSFIAQQSEIIFLWKNSILKDILNKSPANELK